MKFVLLAAFGCALAWCAPPFEARKAGREIRLSAELSASAAKVELRIYSDRNRSISSFSGVSPLHPKPAPPRLTRDAETWYPVVDVELEPGMEAVALFDPAPTAFCSVNGWVRREKQPVRPEFVIPASNLELWENSLWVEPSAPRLKGFYLRKAIPGQGAFRHTLRLLSEDWSGSLVLMGPAGEIARAVVPKAALAARPIPGQGLHRRRLIQSLAATAAYTVRSQNRNPNSPTNGGLHLFYDLDASVYRSSHWIWGYGPSVKMLLDAARIPEVAARFQPGELVRVAGEIGRLTLRSADNRIFPGMPASRWERRPDTEYGHREVYTPADAGFLMGWAWIPLYEATGDRAYLDASKKLAVVLERLTRDFSMMPQNFWVDTRTWGDITIDESGFGTEGIAELYRVTRDEHYRELGRVYMHQHLARLERPDGLWDRGWSRVRDFRDPTGKMTRGLGWAMEGLLACQRMDPESDWLARATKLGDHLLAAQKPDGHLSFVFDQPSKEVGISEKGTALWSLLFSQTYAASRDQRYLEGARRALGWCLDNQYTGPDPEAHGALIGVSPHSAVGYRPWFRVACTYASGFFGLAVLEELNR